MQHTVENSVTLRLPTLLLAASVAASATASPSDTQARALVQKAAQALGLSADNSAWRMNGAFDPFGMAEDWEVEFDASGRWKETLQGEIPYASGFDGHTCWQVDSSGLPLRQVLDHRDLLLLENAVLTGLWALPNGPCQVWKAATGAYTVAIRPRGGTVTAELVLDPRTYLPVTFHANVGVDVDERFAGYKRFGGRVLPTDVGAVVGGQTSHGSVASAVKATIPKESFAIPPRGPQNTSWDHSHTPAVQSRFAFYESVEKPGAYGQLIFVEPLINGKDVGFFLLDTGASGLAISPRVGTALGLRQIGKIAIVGAGGSAGSKVYKAQTLRLGPMAFDEPVFDAFEGLDATLDNLSQALGFKVAGICGFDLFTRASVAIEPLHQTVRLFKPGVAELPRGAHWADVDFDDALPCLQGRFEGNNGFFGLDTGAETTVTFHSWAVRQFKLLRRRTVAGVQSGAGGDLASRTGTLSTFEFAGNRVNGIEVGFATSSSGSFAEPSVAGNIGIGLLGGYGMLFDYAKGRVAFGPR